MVYCSHCGDHCPAIKDPDRGYICCGMCGKILDQDVYATEPSFIKDSYGQSRLAGNIINSIESGYSVSHERTLMRGRDEIRYIVNHLNVGGGDSIVDKAHRFYQIAVDKNFTRGRRTSHVAAACLYIACRQSKKAYLLIDFSDHLRINVYVLGAVFLQLCKILLLSEHPIIQKLIDPSLFIHRFTERLLGRKNNAVSETALRIIASMKRDWMQTGRKPSGLCGAALYISALSHGFDYSKSEIVNVVHVCEATLTKRLIEFENTESGCLTIEEFLTRADEIEKEIETNILPKEGSVLCKHRDNGVTHFAHGLCKKCYDKFIKISGGLEGGAEPPAFQRAEMQRKLAAEKDEKIRESSPESQHFDLDKNGDKVKDFCPDFTGNDSQKTKNPETEGHKSADDASANGETERHKGSDDASADRELPDQSENEDDEPETLSDIDDAEVDEYLHDEEEKHYKKIIWEEMNKEYLEEQAWKEAAAAKKEAAKKAENTRDDDGENKSRKTRKRKHSEDKNAGPAKTPFEATCNILKQKGLGSKVNLDAVGDLYTTDDGTLEREEIDKDFEDFNENNDKDFDLNDVFDF